MKWLCNAGVPPARLVSREDAKYACRNAGATK